MIYTYNQKSPEVDLSCFIADSADIIGEVYIKEKSSIWHQTVLRGDENFISIGRGTNIQDGSVVHVGRNMPTKVGDYVTIGHKAIIHGCTVGDHCLIGMGATILDGAEIGEYTLIGAGSLVTSHVKIPSGVLALGSPAKVIRQLSEQEKKELEESSSYYIKLAQMYKI